MRAAIAVLALVFSLSAIAPASWAVEPDEILDDPVLEARAREISKGLRCLVCQNQSIDDSGAGLARDLRILVRERLVSGDSNSAAIAFIVARYGDFVLLRPPVKPTTYVLWFGPALIFVLAATGLGFFFMRRRRVDTATGPRLSDDERRRVADLLGGGGGDQS